MGAALTNNAKKMDSPGANGQEKDERQPRGSVQARPSSNVRPLSIEGPSNASNTGQTLEPLQSQPRQPTNLQGLLRFAMEAHTATNDPSGNNEIQPMDEERREFLKQTLSSLSGNVIEELRAAVQVLSDINDLQPEEDAFQKEAALERIADYVDNMDIANDFYKIGGFSIFGPCLNSPRGSIRWRVADVIAELAQNNPFCQERFLETGLFPTLLAMVDSDPVETVKIKALYAVSCIVREHPTSLKHMEINDAYSVLLRAMQSSVKKLQIKSAFLLSSLCNKEDNDNPKLTLVNMGLVEQTAGLLMSPDLLPEFRDQLLNILDGLTNNDFHAALTECQRPELCLRSTLERCANELQQEESVDQVDVCHRLLNKIFSERDTNQER